MSEFARSESARRYIPGLSPVIEQRTAARAYLVRYDVVLTEADVAWLKDRLKADVIQHSSTDFGIEWRDWRPSEAKPADYRPNPSRIVVRFAERKWARRGSFDIPRRGSLLVAAVWTIAEVVPAQGGPADEPFCREYIAMGPRPMKTQTWEYVCARKEALEELAAIYRACLDDAAK